MKFLLLVPMLGFVALVLLFYYKYEESLDYAKRQFDCQATCDPYAMVACIAIENGVLAVCKSESGYSAGLVE